MEDITKEEVQRVMEATDGIAPLMNRGEYELLMKFYLRVLERYEEEGEKEKWMTKKKSL